MTDVSLQKLRDEIDLLDDSLIDILNKRFALTDEVARYKNKYNLAILDSTREQQVLDRMKKQCKHPALVECIEAIYSTIAQANREYRKKNLNQIQNTT